MQFLNPIMLWSALAVSIPILLHFWHQKKGKLLNWAATQWLLEKELQPTKGIRLENLFLLIVRCILLVLLTLLLSKLVVNWLNVSDLESKSHLVQPNKLLVENFKFELEDAIKKGEKLYWLNPLGNEIKDLSELKGDADFDGLKLQTAINKISENLPQNQQVELYVVNDQNLQNLPNIYLPNQFKIHDFIDSFEVSKRPFLKFSDTNYLFVNSENHLTKATSFQPNFENSPTKNNAIEVLIETKNSVEKQKAEASLKAINDVYKVMFMTDYQRVKDKKYDFILNDKEIVNSEMLVEKIVNHFNLNPNKAWLSAKQLASIFREQKQKKKFEENKLSKILLILFISTLSLERWLAIKKNS